MSNQNDLLLSILAMDAYNRGYDVGLGMPNNSLGDATIQNDSISLLGGAAQAASFYAASYSTGAGTVIFYRGTDSLQDVLSWRISFGRHYADPQAELAAQFYQDLKGSSASTFTLTGHSLGGALAGFIGSIYGLPATPIDNIDFIRTADALYSAVTTRNAITSIANQAIQRLYYPSGLIPKVDSSQVRALQVVVLPPQGTGERETQETTAQASASN
jgi:hypothetical protein